MEIMERFIDLCNFLSKVLNNNSEIVLHDLTTPEESIIFIANNHISGRKLGMPVTDLLLEEIQEAESKNVPYFLNYVGTTQSGKVTNSSTYIIKDPQKKIIGALCINEDQGLFNDLENIMNIMKEVYVHKSEHTEDIKEQLTINIDGIVNQSINEYCKKYDVKNFGNKHDKIKLFKYLYKKNIFSLKGSIDVLAENLGISLPTAYRYLNEVKSMDSESECHTFV